MNLLDLFDLSFVGRRERIALEYGAGDTNPTTPIELYNLKTDLGEKTNVAAQHADVTGRITEIMEGARTNSPHFPGRR